MKRSKKIVAALIALTAGGFLAISSTSVLASQPKTDMVDLSAWQGAISNLGYQNMKNSGVKAITIKATEGTFYKKLFEISKSGVGKLRQTLKLPSLYWCAAVVHSFSRADDIFPTS